MAGTGLPLPQHRDVTLVQPAPLVPTDDGAAKAWGQTAATAERMTDRFAAMADHAQQLEETKYRAQLDQTIQQRVQELHAQHPDDPEAFRNGMEGLRNGILGGVDLRHADMARLLIGERETQALGKVWSAFTAKQQAMTQDALDTRLKTLSDEAQNYAFNGDHESAVRSVDDFEKYANDKVKAGGWSTEHAVSAVARLSGLAQSATLLRSVRDTFTGKGVNAALEEIDRLAADPKLPVTLADRDHFRSQARAIVNDLEGRRARDQAVQTQRDAETYAVRLDDMTIRASRGQLTHQELASAYQDGAGWLAPNDHTRLTKEVDRITEQAAEEARTIQRVELAGKSVAAQPPALADRIIGAEWSATGPDKNPNSSAKGPGQFIDSTWVSTMRRHAPELANGKTDAEVLALRDAGTPEERRALHRRMVQGYADDNRAALAGKGLPTDDGAVYLSHFAGPGGAEKVLSADPATPVAQILSEDAMRANARMKLNGKPFGEWTAADLRSWATSQVQAQAEPVAVRVPHLDPRNDADRKAVDLHYSRISEGWASLSPADRQERQVSAIERYGMVPPSLAGDIRGTLRRGRDAEKVAAARFVSRLEARFPWAARDLDGDDFALAHMVNAWVDAGADPVTAVTRAEEAMSQPKPVRDQRDDDYRQVLHKDPRANARWLVTNQGERWGFFNDVAVPTELTAEFNDLVRDRYRMTGDLDVARKVAWNDLRRSWGETSIGGRRFQRNAPEVVYQNGKDPGWIEEQLHADLAPVLNLPADKLSGRVRLEADRITSHERAPSYRVVVKDEFGAWDIPKGPDGAPVLGPDGRPLRFRPDYGSSPAAQREAEGTARTVSRARAARDMLNQRDDLPPASSTAGIMLNR